MDKGSPDYYQLPSQYEFRKNNHKEEKKHIWVKNISSGFDVKPHRAAPHSAVIIMKVTKVQFSTIEVFVAMPMTR